MCGKPEIEKGEGLRVLSISLIFVLKISLSRYYISEYMDVNPVT